MSTSQLLTPTESHAFRALTAAITWILGLISRLARGLQNLTASNRRNRPEVRNPAGLRYLSADAICLLWGPVLWFDIVGRRDGPAAKIAPVGIGG